MNGDVHHRVTVVMNIATIVEMQYTSLPIHTAFSPANTALTNAMACRVLRQLVLRQDLLSSTAATEATTSAMTSFHAMPVISPV